MYSLSLSFPFSITVTFYYWNEYFAAHCVLDLGINDISYPNNFKLSSRLFGAYAAECIIGLTVDSLFKDTPPWLRCLAVKGRSPEIIEFEFTSIPDVAPASLIRHNISCKDASIKAVVINTVWYVGYNGKGMCWETVIDRAIGSSYITSSCPSSVLPSSA